MLEAKIHSGLAILSNSENVVFLTCISSKAASTIRSQSAHKFSFKPGVIFARIASTFSCVIFSLATSLAYPFAILSFPPSAHSCLISQSATSYPSTCANALAIPWPIVPAPITPTFIFVPPNINIFTLQGDAMHPLYVSYLTKKLVFLNDCRTSHSTTDAKCSKTSVRSTLLHLMKQCNKDTASRSSYRMTKCDCTTVYVYLAHIEL